MDAPPPTRTEFGVVLMLALAARAVALLLVPDPHLHDAEVYAEAGRRLLTDPQLNILLGSFYLQKLILQFDDLNAALAAYNVGPNRLHYLMTTQGHVPRSYSRKVQRVTAELREEFF